MPKLLVRNRGEMRPGGKIWISFGGMARSVLKDKSDERINRIVYDGPGDVGAGGSLQDLQQVSGVKTAAAAKRFLNVTIRGACEHGLPVP